MATTWIVSGDSSRARVLQVTGRNRLEEIEDFVNPKARMNDRELRTDAHARFNGHGGMGRPGSGSGIGMGPANDREEQRQAELETENFSRHIGRYLDKARIERRYDRLFLIAPPRFLGMIRKQLGKEVEKLVQDEIDKDLSWFDAQHIDDFLRGNGTPMKYP